MLYLVTGAAGFIGSNLVRRLLGLGETVRGIDNFSTGRQENIADLLDNKNFTFTKGDITDLPVLQEVMTGVDYVLHQAAIPSVPRSVADPLRSHQANSTGTVCVLQVARSAGVKRVVLASSSSVYGDTPALPKVEEMPYSPLSPYALNKMSLEQYAQLFHSLYGLETVCLRYFNVFGPHQDPDSPYAAVIPKFIRAMAQGQSPQICGDGLQTRDFTYIDNVVQANLLACTAPAVGGQVFNIAAGAPFSILDLVRLINESLGTTIAPQFLEARAGDIKHSHADIHAAQERLGYQPSVDFKTGLSLTITSILNS